MRDAILISDLGTSWVTAGAPELERGRKGGALLTEGPYARTRNPRYIATIVWILAYPAFSNYLGAHLIAVETIG